MPGFLVDDIVWVNLGWWDIQALLLLVELLHFCALIGRELHSEMPLVGGFGCLELCLYGIRELTQHHYEALDQWERSKIGARPMRAKPGYISGRSYGWWPGQVRYIQPLLSLVENHLKTVLWLVRSRTEAVWPRSPRTSSRHWDQSSMMLRSHLQVWLYTVYKSLSCHNILAVYSV